MLQAEKLANGVSCGTKLQEANKRNILMHKASRNGPFLQTAATWPEWPPRLNGDPRIFTPIPEPENSLIWVREAPNPR